jgi:hypothetical protein
MARNCWREYDCIKRLITAALNYTFDRATGSSSGREDRERNLKAPFAGFVVTSDRAACFAQVQRQPSAA